MKIAVLGANGQVGAEVSLLLSRTAGIEVVPVCRNRSGSAFLRAHGLRCRHGLAADPVEARGLLGDCDVIANFALALGRPREAREANRRLIEAAAAAAKPGSRIVFFSTLAVYNDFVEAGTPPASTAYGKEKLRGEREAMRAGRRLGHETWVLRLGHVYGQLQGIRAQMRNLVCSGPVVVPRGGSLGSNVTHTVTIVDALLKIGQGKENPGVYDLLSFPSWSWNDVLLHEARTAGVDLQRASPDTDPFDSARMGVTGRVRQELRRRVGALLGSPRVREIGLTWIAYLPEAINLQLQSRHFRRRAVSDIARLNHRPVSHQAFGIPPVNATELVSLTPTMELLLNGKGDVPLLEGGAFQPDLPLYPNA